MPKSLLNPKALSAVEELRGQGIEPTPDELIALHEAGRSVDEAARGADLLLLDQPIRVGNALFHPLTVGASVWWSECGSVWFDASHPLMTMVLAFALAHARTPGTFAELSSADRTIKAVRQWMRGLTATRAEIDAGIDLALGRAAPRTEAADTDAGWLPFCSQVAAAFPASFHDWLWTHPAELVVRLLRHHLEAQGNKLDPRYDPVARAVIHIQQLTNDIAEAHKGAA